MSEARDLTGEKLFFRCGHEKTDANMAPKGIHHRTGKPAFRCRTCLQEKDRERFHNDPRRREASKRRAKLARQRNRGPAMKDRLADLERENAVLRQELDATVQALIEARCDSGRHPEGEKPKALSGEAMPERPNEDSASPNPSSKDHP